jgi:transcriptional regulator with XRE-family HTH domain
LNATTIKATRAGLDWTQAHLAAEAGLHPKSVAYWERMPGELPVNRNGAPSRMKEALARAGVVIVGDGVRFHMVQNHGP